MTKILIIAFCFLFSSALAIPSQPQTFSDVPPEHPFYTEIEAVAAANIMGEGSTVFGPDDPLLRFQAAVIIEKAAFNVFSPPPIVKAYFDDIDDTNEDAGYIEDLRARGVTNGCGVRLFCPYEPTTREQLAAFIVRAKGEFNPPSPFPGTFRFMDVEQSSPFYAYIHRLRELGVTNGCAQFLYCPTDTVSRGQMAAFVYRSFLAN